MFVRACWSHSASLSRSSTVSRIGGVARLSCVQFSLAVCSLMGSLASRSISQPVTTFPSCLGECSSLRGDQEKYIILWSDAVGLSRSTAQFSRRPKSGVERVRSITDLEFFSSLVGTSVLFRRS